MKPSLQLQHHFLKTYKIYYFLWFFRTKNDEENVTCDKGNFFMRCCVENSEEKMKITKSDAFPRFRDEEVGVCFEGGGDCE